MTISPDNTARTFLVILDNIARYVEVLEDTDTVQVSNVVGQTVAYGSTPATADGTLAVGASVNVTAGTWFRAQSGTAKINVTELPLSVVSSGQAGQTLASRIYTVAAPTGVAATDTTAINAKITAANAAGGGDIYLDGGNYSINALVTLSTGVNLFGLGINATTITLASTSAGLVFGADNQIIRDVKIVSTQTTSTANGSIFGQGVNGCRIENVRFEGGTHQINLNTCARSQVINTVHAVPTVAAASCMYLFSCDRLRVLNPTVEAGVWPTSTTALRIILFTTCTRSSIVGADVRGVDLSVTASTSSAAGISFSGSTQCSAIGCIVDSLKGADGISVEASSSDITITGCESSNHNASAGAGSQAQTGDGIDIFNSSRVLVSNCVFRSNGLIGAHPNIEIYTCTDVTVNNCVASNSTGSQGVRIQGVTNATLIGVTARLNNNAGLSASADASANEVTNLRVIGCDFSDNNVADSGVGGAGEGIYLAAATTATIIGTRTTDTRTPKKQRYGIRMENTSRATVIGCDLRGNLTGALQDSVGNSQFILPETGGTGVQTLTYSASIAIDAMVGAYKYLSVSDTVAFTINNPTNAYKGAQLTFAIYNGSGGVMGAITWGNQYFLAGAFTNPGSGKRRTITFTCVDGVNWFESSRAAADL